MMAGRATVPASGVNPNFVAIQIDRLGPSERALLTVTSTSGENARESIGETPYLTIHENPRYAPILYFSSDQDSGDVLAGISWKNAANWEEANFPNSIIGYWVSCLNIKKGVVPSIDDMKHLEIEYDLVEDQTATKTGTGTLSMHNK